MVQTITITEQRPIPTEKVWKEINPQLRRKVESQAKLMDKLKEQNQELHDICHQTSPGTVSAYPVNRMVVESAGSLQFRGLLKFIPWANINQDNLLCMPNFVFTDRQPISSSSCSSTLITASFQCIIKLCQGGHRVVDSMEQECETLKL